LPGKFRRLDELDLDLKRYELRRGDTVLRLEKIPMEMLIFLVEHKDQLVSREEIIERIWGKDVFLDAEQGINTAIRKIRLAIRDDPEQPRYLQTVVGKGYRFVGPITVIASNGSAELGMPKELGLPYLEPVSPLSTSPPRRYGLRIALVAGAVLSILAFLTLRTNIFGPRNRPLNRNLSVVCLLLAIGWAF